ncbi:MAG: N-acetylglucosamine-specific PTS transporter subunit IIBC [Erythrobacter sp.]
MKERAFAVVQQLGRSLMLPIAVLPVAGLLLRLGQPDLFDIAFISAAGDAIFANLGLIFAAGVGIGFARDNHGAAGLAGLVAYLIATHSAEALIAAPPGLLVGLDADAATRALADYRAAAISKLGVPLGIVCGIIAGQLFNRYSNMKLPDFLAFFGGRRFVPIAAGTAALIIGFLFGEFWTYAEAAIDGASRAIVGAGELGLFVYGALNRLLIVTGLHHILNNVAWFVVGEYQGATGDLRRFFAGDPEAGAFMAGFFPVMMFGMPAACLAMYRAALPERRKQVAGLYLSMALTSALTGITEPIEFTFIFLAPVLFLVHAALTGLSMVVMDLLNVKLGFGFSAGLIDYVLNYGIATNPLLLLPVGAVYFAVYYVSFSAVIRRFNLATPGRDAAEAATLPAQNSATDDKAAAWLAALGGSGNLAQLGACTTRLRLVLTEGAKVDEAALKALGARGVIRPTADTMQVIIGPTAELLAGEIGAAMSRSGATGAALDAQQQPTGTGFDRTPYVAALGGEANIIDLSRIPGRLVARLREPSHFKSELLPEDTRLLHAQLIGENSLHILLDERSA